VPKFNVKIKDGDKEVDEEVAIDTEKQTETLSIPKLKLILGAREKSKLSSTLKR